MPQCQTRAPPVSLPATVQCKASLPTIRPLKPGKGTAVSLEISVTPFGTKNLFSPKGSNAIIGQLILQRTEKSKEL